MDWLNDHQLLNFWLVAREGTVQRASELLHVTPASVSIQVRQLERSLGMKLVKRLDGAVGQRLAQVPDALDARLHRFVLAGSASRAS